VQHNLVRTATASLEGIGRFTLLLWTAFGSMSDVRLVYRNLLVQMREIGVASLPICMLAVAFTGGVTTLQSIYHMNSPLLPPSLVGTFSVPSLVMELGPLIVAFILTARVGARIAAELGTMRVTEQIDALNTLGTDPIKKLVTPRVVAALVMLPVLTIINDLVGILGGMIIAKFIVGLPASLYMRTVWEQMMAGGFTFGIIPNDFIQGLSKPFVFGAIISVTGCYFGLATTGGTEGVGQATTRTVVTSSVLILVTDYFLTQLILSLLGQA
jgi:phospholipid/cholesterol/gamma-HCH transport system permease protein